MTTTQEQTNETTETTETAEAINALKGRTFVDKTDPWKIFEMDLPNGEVARKRFRRQEPVCAVVIHREDDSCFITRWSSKTKGMDRLVKIAEEGNEGAKGIFLVGSESIRFVGEEEAAAPPPKKDKPAVEASEAGDKEAPKKVKPKKEVSKDGGQTFKTKAAAQVAAKAVGKKAKDVKKLKKGGWVIA